MGFSDTFGSIVGGATAVLGAPVAALAPILGGGGLGLPTGTPEGSPLGSLGDPGTPGTSASGEAIPTQPAGAIVPGALGLVQNLIGGITSGIPIVGPLADSLMTSVFGNAKPVQGQGRVRYTTVVLGVYENGFITEQRFAGKPYLMNKDVVTMKRTLKLSQNLAKRVPRKTVKESPVSKLKTAAVEQALRITQRDDCPPPSCCR